MSMLRFSARMHGMAYLNVSLEGESMHGMGLLI